MSNIMDAGELILKVMELRDRRTTKYYNYDPFVVYVNPKYTQTLAEVWIPDFKTVKQRIFEVGDVRALIVTESVDEVELEDA